MAKEGIDTRHYDVIVAPHITEKSTLLSEHNAVVFKRGILLSLHASAKLRMCLSKPLAKVFGTPVCLLQSGNFSVLQPR